MTSSSLILLVALAISVPEGRRASQPDPCPARGVEASAVRAEIQTLRTSPKRRARAKAARSLARVDWKCHPDAVLALSDAMLLDPEKIVREQAAGSLEVLRPCVPAVHEALTRAAERDPAADVREGAREAIRAMGKRCIVDCPICGPMPAGSVIQGPTIIPDDWLPFLAPDPKPRDRPDRELPPALPAEAVPPSPRAGR